MVKLIDVYPDGRAFNLYDAALRLRYREGFDRPAPLVPGHRIRIEIAGSSFPGFERNLQTGGRNYDEKDPVVAVNRIHPGSFFTFPVIDPK